jgi:hypothetical protein
MPASDGRSSSCIVTSMGRGLATLTFTFTFALALALAAGVGCKGPMAKIEALRDALVTDEASAIGDATSGYPSCTDPTCLPALANAIGSKHGFVASPPDHAAATTVAVVLVRDARGDWLTNADDWLADVRNGKGIGHDVLRLAIARQMANGTSAVGHPLDDDTAARAALLAVVAAVPGACPTYQLVGTSVDPKTIPPEQSPDHSACVQKDLARREGPGASYGSGTRRAAEGALALWREAERALRLGLPNADTSTQAVVQKKLALIDAATRKIAPARAELANPSATLSYIGDAHADAGVVFLRPPDAGSDASPR